VTYAACRLASVTQTFRIKCKQTEGSSWAILKWQTAILILAESQSSSWCDGIEECLDMFQYLWIFAGRFKAIISISKSAEAVSLESLSEIFVCSGYCSAELDSDTAQSLSMKPGDMNCRVENHGIKEKVTGLAWTSWCNHSSFIKLSGWDTASKFSTLHSIKIYMRDPTCFWVGGSKLFWYGSAESTPSLSEYL
jgi:hypothetical protein